MFARVRLVASLGCFLVGAMVLLPAQRAVAQYVDGTMTPAAGTMAGAAAAARMYGGRHSHPGGVRGPAQAMASQAAMQQQMMMRQQLLAAQATAQKKAEKKERIRQNVMARRDKESTSKKTAKVDRSEVADEK